MILKYRTTSLSSPPHTPYSYIDSISHISPIYNPLTSTLTVNLTLRTPTHSIPTSLVLNDLAFLLTDDGRILDKVFDPNFSSNSSNPNPNSYYHQKPYKSYNKPYYKKPYYNSKPSSDFPPKDSDDSDSSDNE